MSRRTVSANGSHGIPEATIARLPVYLRVLYAFAEQDIATVSSEELAAAAGVNSAKLRKDLSHLGSYGTRGVGYDVDYLVYQVSRELGLTQDWPVVIVGAGNLGRAGLAHFVELVSGDGGTVLAALPDATKDMVFLDSERPEYAGWWPHPTRVLRPGGLLVVDNVLSHPEEVAPLLRLVEADPGLTSTVVAVGKGELLAVKAQM